MFQYVLDFLGSAYHRSHHFLLLVAYFVTHRQDQRMVKSGSMLQVFILLIIFIYFAWMPLGHP